MTDLLENTIANLLDTAVLYTSFQGSIATQSGIPYDAFSSNSTDDKGNFHHIEGWTKTYQEGDITLKLKKLFQYTSSETDTSANSRESTSYDLNFICANGSIMAHKSDLSVSSQQKGHTKMATENQDTPWSITQGREYLPLLFTFFLNSSHN